MMKKLKKGGILSISLPTDPGLLFRIGRLNQENKKQITLKTRSGRISSFHIERKNNS
jgi:hypothetical protein